MSRRSLDIKNYVKNASKNLSYKRLILYTIISLLLTLFLLYSVIKYEHKGSAIIFSLVALLLIGGYTVLNVIAIIKKKEISR